MLQILFAVLAGVLTIAAPCILPLLPILLGASVGHKSATRPVCIVLGFTLTFALAGLFVSFLANHVGLNPTILREVAIAILALFGVLLVWSTPFEFLVSKLGTLIHRAGALSQSAGSGNVGGFILGMTLGLVWTPCAGPVLGSVLTLVALQKDLLTAGILLVAYAVGAGVPMLLIAYGGQYLTSRVKLFARYTRRLQQVCGIIIVLLAVALYFNYDTKLYALILQYCPAYNPKFFL